MTYEEYIEQRIFAPLGMTRSMYCNSMENVPRRAHGYFVSREREIRRAWTVAHTWPFAAGSLCSTGGDMVTWLRALHGGRVLSAASYAEFIAPAKLNDGTPLRYSMGLQVGPDPSGLRMQERPPKAAACRSSAWGIRSLSGREAPAGP
jgi:CubicO group peptidase (beta-lactamase class C family)